MSELSPQAQEVFWAFNQAASGKPDDWHYLPAIAAALRAVIEKCAYDDFGGHWIVSADDIDRIATELEAQ
jgi:hypothetical protein